MLRVILFSFFLYSSSIAFHFGSSEREFLVNHLNTLCLPHGEKLCAKMDTEHPSLLTKCVVNETVECSDGIVLSRTTCEECRHLWCKEGGLCTNEASLCNSVSSSCPAKNSSITNNLMPNEVCVRRGTLEEKEDGTCLCRMGFTGETCDTCDERPASLEDSVYLCCKVNSFGLIWALVAPRQFYVNNFLGGDYTEGEPCKLPNVELDDGSIFECDCQIKDDNENYLDNNVVEPIWLAEAMISGGLVKNKITDAIQSDLETEDAIQGVIAFAVAISLVVLILIICIFIIFFLVIQPATQVIRRQVAPQSTTTATTINSKKKNKTVDDEEKKKKPETEPLTINFGQDKKQL